MLSTIKEFEFTERDFTCIRELVARYSGISLSDAKRDLVYGRLKPRLRSLSINTFSEYCEYLESGNDNGELTMFVNAITTNLTAFFREQHHFEYLSNSIIPELMAQKRPGKRFRIWSAGCSTGEEPYSIAITLQETIADIDNWDIKILATDIDSNVINKARQGVYPSDRVDKVDKHRLQKWFLKGKDDNNGMVCVRNNVKSLVTFQVLNLMESWPMKGEFDLIFCRNVVIYFNKDTQRQLFGRMAEITRPGGYLMIGHSESLHNVSDIYKPLGKTIYRKMS
jgi:chemotaxis protein methyltransferase CheR